MLFYAIYQSFGTTVWWLLSLKFSHTHLIKSLYQYGEPSICIKCNRHHMKQGLQYYFIQKASEFSGCLPKSQKWSSNQDPLYQKTLTGHHQLFDEWCTWSHISSKTNGGVWSKTTWWWYLNESLQFMHYH